MNDNGKVLQIPIEDIVPNRFQPRISFDEKALEELAKSIKQHGIIQPLVVRQLGDKYEIIAGERRYKAAQKAGLISIPAIVSDLSDQESAEVALVENVQRQDLSAIEEARSYKNILDKSDMTQDGLAKKMGLSQSSVANKLRLLNLSDEVQKAVMDGKISERHARSLLQIEDINTQNELLNRVIDERLTVRQLDTIIKEMKKPTKDDEMEDVPLVDIDENLERIKNEATDINPSFIYKNDVSSEPKSTINPERPKNKFFNFSLATPSSASDYVNKIDKEENNDSAGFFDFVSSASNDLNNLANETNYEVPVQTEKMTEDILDIDNNSLDNDEPIIDMDSPIIDIPKANDSNTETLEEDIETLDVEDSPGVFDNVGNDWRTKTNRIKKVVDELNVSNDLSIEESDTPEYYKVTITVKKD